MTDQHRIDAVANALLSLHRHETGAEGDLEKAREAVLSGLLALSMPADPVAEPEPLKVTAVEVEPVQVESYELPRRITSSVLVSAGFEDSKGGADSE